MFLKIEQLCETCKLEIAQKDKNKIVEKLNNKKFYPSIVKTNDEVKLEKIK